MVRGKEYSILFFFDTDESYRPADGFTPSDDLTDPIIKLHGCQLPLVCKGNIHPAELVPITDRDGRKGALFPCRAGTID